MGWKKFREELAASNESAKRSTERLHQENERAAKQKRKLTADEQTVIGATATVAGNVANSIVQ